MKILPTILPGESCGVFNPWFCCQCEHRMTKRVTDHQSACVCVLALTLACVKQVAFLSELLFYCPTPTPSKMTLTMLTIYSFKQK